MEFPVKTGSPVRQKTACAVIPIFEDAGLSGVEKELSRPLKKLITTLKKRKEAPIKLGSTCLIPLIRGTTIQKTLLVGCGKAAKFDGKNFKEANILKPSVIYSVDDNFTTNFMTILGLLPIFPLYYNGSTLFRPIYISDLTEIIYQMIAKNIKSTTLECVGPEEISLKNILKRLLKLIGKKRLLIPIPLVLAQLSAIFFQLFPRPLITLDQLKLLKYQNIPSGKYKTNFDLKMPSNTKFDDEVKKYSYMWREGGQFSTVEETKN